MFLVNGYLEHPQLVASLQQRLYRGPRHRHSAHRTCALPGSNIFARSLSWQLMQQRLLIPRMMYNVMIFTVALFRVVHFVSKVIVKFQFLMSPSLTTFRPEVCFVSA